MAPAPSHRTIRDVQVLVIAERDHLAAVCLEPYVVAEATDVFVLWERFTDHWNAYIVEAREQGRDPFTNMPAAPAKYRTLYAQGRPLFQKALPTPPFQVRATDAAGGAQPEVVAHGAIVSNAA